MSVAITELEDAEAVALAKAIASKVTKAAQTTLSPGPHEVDFTVRIKGELNRGEDYEQKIVAKADPWLLLAAALSHLNDVTVESLVREALLADKELVKSIKEGASEAIQAIKAPTTSTCNGKVTTSLEVTKV
jgi:hypothetical protein